MNILLVLLVFQCLIFGIFLLQRRQHKNANLYLAIFFLTQAVASASALVRFNRPFFFTYYPYLFLIGEAFYYIAMPSLYLYTKAIAFSDSRPKWFGFPHYIPFVLVAGFYVIIFHAHSIDEKRAMLQSGMFGPPTFTAINGTALFTQMGMYIAAALLVIRKYRTLIKEEFSRIETINLSWMSFILYGFFCALLTSIIPFVLFLALGIRPEPFHLVNVFAFFAFFNIIFYRALIQPELFAGIEEKPRYSTSKLNRSDADNYASQLAAHMEREKPYLNPNVSLQDISSQLSIPPRFLSQVINEHYHKNFFDFINQYRIEEAKKLILSPANSNKKMFAILCDAGFNSKSSFNAAFKKNVGMTPSEFRSHT